MLERVIWGIIMMAVSVVAIVYARKIVEFLGTSATLERYLGSGGTYMGLRIFGVILFFFAILYTFGFVEEVVSNISRALFGA